MTPSLPFVKRINAVWREERLPYASLNVGRERQKSGWLRSIPTSRGGLLENNRKNISILSCALPI